MEKPPNPLGAKVSPCEIIKTDKGAMSIKKEIQSSTDPEDTTIEVEISARGVLAFVRRIVRDGLLINKGFEIRIGRLEFEFRTAMIVIFVGIIFVLFDIYIFKFFFKPAPTFWQLLKGLFI
ncbi:hypothetical protein KR018_011426 [Drosophila ironensis]|nr:hypothetical protein KR018_011426 [Drosophila ironensis]